MTVGRGPWETCSYGCGGAVTHMKDPNQVTAKEGEPVVVVVVLVVASGGSGDSATLL